MQAIAFTRLHVEVCLDRRGLGCVCTGVSTFEHGDRTCVCRYANCSSTSSCLKLPFEHLPSLHTPMIPQPPNQSYTGRKSLKCVNTCLSGLSQNKSPQQNSLENAGKWSITTLPLILEGIMALDTHLLRCICHIDRLSFGRGAC